MVYQKSRFQFKPMSKFFLQLIFACTFASLACTVSAHALELPEDCLSAFNQSLALSPDLNAKNYSFARDGRLLDKASGKLLAAQELLAHSAQLEFDEQAKDTFNSKPITLNFKQKIEIKRIDFSHFEISYDRKAKEIARLESSGQLADPTGKTKLENVQDAKQIETFEFKKGKCRLTQVKQKDATSYWVEFDQDLCQKWSTMPMKTDKSKEAATTAEKLLLLSEASKRVKQSAQHLLYAYDFIDDDDNNQYRFLAQTESCKKYSPPQAAPQTERSSSQRIQRRK